MKASIITIGDEILIGQTVDTNSAWISAQLTTVGIPVIETMSISDTREHIISAIDRLNKVSDIIIITGGLGPTNDDITKKVLTDYFDDTLVQYDHVLERIQKYFDSLNRPMMEVHFQQGLLPKNARIIDNELGTASGMWFTKDRLNIISLPGVPYEMKGLMKKVIDLLVQEFHLEKIYHRTIHFQGMGESTLADKVSDIEEQCNEEGIKVAYLPSVGLVKIRLSGPEDLSPRIDERVQEMYNRFPKHAFGFDSTSLEIELGKLLSEQKLSVSTVESCTGGNVAGRITSVSGSSDYYLGSIISYANEVKSELVGVPSELITDHGAVSKEVVESMAENGRRLLKADYCISTSGIAGPSGGSDEKPVGTIWIGIAGPDGTHSKRFRFNHNRSRNIESAVIFSLNFLRRVILGLQEE